MLSRFSEWNAEDPLEVFCDCSGTVECAQNAGTALSYDNPRRHNWIEWWAGIGRRASVCKVKAHQSEANAITDHDTWLIRGNRMADKYAKQGAKLWAIPERWPLFVSGCKRIVRDCALWHGRAQAAFGSLEQPDSDGIAGTADIEFEDEFSQALQEACQEAGVRPFERGPRAMGAMGSALPPPPPPPHPAPRDFLQVSGVPWVLRGHSIVQATVQAEDGAALDDIIFCKCCGASAHQSARGGLQSNCEGSSHSGYKTQRSSLKRGLFPGHNLGKATVGTPFGPTDGTKAVWGPLLGFEPVGGGAGWDAGPTAKL